MTGVASGKVWAGLLQGLAKCPIGSWDGVGFTIEVKNDGFCGLCSCVRSCLILCNFLTCLILIGRHKRLDLCPVLIEFIQHDKMNLCPHRLLCTITPLFKALAGAF
jgi:hypothetical protein